MSKILFWYKICALEQACLLLKKRKHSCDTLRRSISKLRLVRSKIKEMTMLTFRKRCPRCNKSTFQRESRKIWMRFVPMSKYYSCNNCLKRFLLISSFSFILRQSRISPWRHSLFSFTYSLLIFVLDKGILLGNP